MRKSIIEMKEEVLQAETLLQEGIPLIVFDVETTGINYKVDRILSFSALKVILENNMFKVVDKKNIFLNPGFHIPEKITEINGITDEQVKNCPTEEQAIEEIYHFFEETPFVAGYNSISFDEKFINAMYMRTMGIPFTPRFHIDVMKMGKEKVALSSYKLCNLAHELGTDVGLTFHQSMDDVIATLRCFDILRLEYTCPEPPKVTKKIKTGDARYWEGPRWNLRRIYIHVYPPYQQTKVYYDIIKKEWVSDNDTIDLDDVRGQILEKYHVNNEQSLVEALS